ncbi:uncharacterized protein LOC143283538 [Babylonia areolata]|uniref:uncharacterized protein LOC143283538 n=1 Tax=Babylonia areolata TaxID=304850 RepID=UPI003FD6954C
MADERETPLESASQTENDEKKKEEEEVQDSDSDESEEDESDDEELFEVEKIISRKKRNGAYLYRVRWKGYSPSSDTWEPVENLDIVADMVREYDALQEEKAKSRQEERRIRKLRMEGKKLPGEESSDDNSDSSKEESQLCETTKFFKRLEKDRDLVWSQPDLYSKVKSRSASLSSKKQQEEQLEEASVPAPSMPKIPQAQHESSRGRGRGRPRGGGGAAREKGTGRGRGRPPKKLTSKSSDEEDDGAGSIASPTKSAGRGRGRPRKSEKGSISDSLSDDSSSLSDSSSQAGGDKQSVKDLEGKGDSDDSAPLAQINSSKKPSADSSEKRDSKEPTAAGKPAGKPRGRPPKKVAKEETRDSDSSALPVTKLKSAGRGRGRPRKTAPVRENLEDSDADPDKRKVKDDSGVAVKTKGRSRGRPPKSKELVIDSSDENEKSDDSAPLVKKSKVPHKEKLTSDHSEDNEASDVSLPPVKKKGGRGRGRPRKNVISDTSEDNESDSAASVTKINETSQDRSRMAVITEHSEENDSGEDFSSSRKTEDQTNKSNKTPASEKAAEKEDDSVFIVKSKASGKTKSKSKSRNKIEDSESEGSVSDHSSVRKKSPQPSQTSEKKKPKKATKTKKDSEGRKQQPNSSSGNESKKTVTKPEKASPSDITLERTAPSKTSSQQSGADGAVVDSRNRASETTLATSSSSSLSSTHAKTTPQESSLKTLPTPSSRSKSESVIPVLEKLAMASVTDHFPAEPSNQNTVDQREAQFSAALSNSKGDFKSEPVNAQKKAAKKSSKDNKEIFISPKKLLTKGLKKGVSTKRKMDTAVGHAEAVKEGGASPLKVSSSQMMPPCSAADLQSMLKIPAALSSQLLAGDSAVNSSSSSSSAPPSSPCPVVNASAISSDLSATASASVNQAAALTDPVTPEDTKSASSSPAYHKLSVDAKLKPSKSKQKAQLSKSHKSSPKSKSSSTKAEKQKSAKEGKSVEENMKTATCSSGQLPSTESGSHSSVSEASSLSDKMKTAAQKKDLSGKSSLTGNDVPSTCKAEVTALKSERMDAPDCKLTRPDPITVGMVRPQTVEKTSLADQTDPRTVRAEGDHLKRSHSVASELSPSMAADSGKQSMPRTSSTSDLGSPLIQGAGKQSMLRSGSTSELSSALSSSLARSSLYSLSGSSPGRSTPTQVRDPLLSTPPSKDTPVVFSSPGSSRDASSLYTFSRDFSMSGRMPSWGSVSPRDQPQMLGSPKDAQFCAGASAGRDYLISGLSRDIQTMSRDASQASGLTLSTGGYPYMSGRESSLLYSPGRGISQFRDGWGIAPRPDFNANIAGKDLADKLSAARSLPRTSSLSSSEGDRPKQSRGPDNDLGEALHNIDLEYVEKLVLAPVTPMELSHDELRQAVIDGNCYLVERALKCSTPYDLDLPDNRGYTLLMNAVLRGCDDIIVHLLSHGASAEVQIKGNTALMLAVEHAECSTVYMLLEMGAHVNTADNSGETALFKAVRRGDKQILKLVLDHGADFNWMSQARLTALQTAKQYRLADIDVTLTDHIHRVVEVFEDEIRRVIGGAARLTSCLFPHRCVRLRDTESFTVSFEYRPSLPSGPSIGYLLFIAHARFEPDVRCRLYGQCAVQKVTLNGVDQLCITEESNFVMVFHPLITGWNELVIRTQKDPMTRQELAPLVSGGPSTCCSFHKKAEVITVDALSWLTVAVLYSQH